ncbi:hypothetical protein ACWY4P_40930 [Streptomyces sp. LZ34]
MASNDDLARLVQGEQIDAVVRMEDETSRQAVGGLEDDCEALARSTLRAWTRAFGGPRSEAGSDAVLDQMIRTVRDAIRRVLSGVGERARRALRRALASAVSLGAAQGSQFLARLTGQRQRPASASPSRDLAGAPDVLPDVVDEQRRGALSLLRTALVRRSGVTGLLAAVGRARATAGRIRAHVAFTLNQAVNEGLTAGIRSIGAQKLWVAERDACVRCAAYAGLIAEVDADFPGGLSWDPQQRGRGEPLPAPPLHPHCRCRCVAWKDEWATPGVPSFPAALRREARRSVARGWSLPSESNAARIRAARELLRRGAGLPRSVEEFAATAVRAGRFEDRTFPATGPGAG